MTIGSFGIFRLKKPLEKIAGLALVARIVLVTRVMEGLAHPLARTVIFFKVYALDSDLNIQAGSEQTNLQEAMRITYWVRRIDGSLPEKKVID
jgi:hypothetical protein